MWELLGTITPSGDWQYFVNPLSSRLLRLTYFGDETWLEKYQPRLYLRLKVGDEGYTEQWETVWPKSGVSELMVVTPITVVSNYLDLRKRRNFESLQANYTLTVEQYMGDPYRIISNFTVVGDPFTVDGVTVIL
ncbi:MAG: hypothetical protein AAFR99_05765 [Cyanobacteria bacterium J06629_9]